MEGSQKSWNDIMSQWMKLQQTYWREWMTFTEKSMESMMGMAKMGASTAEETAAPWNLYQNWFESFRKVFAEKDKGGLGASVFNRVFSASRVYLDLLDFWSKSLGSFKDLSIAEPLRVE